MADTKNIERAQYEGNRDAQLMRSRRPDQEISEEKARDYAAGKWPLASVYQKDWSKEVEQAYVQAFVDEIVKSNPR